MLHSNAYGTLYILAYTIPSIITTLKFSTLSSIIPFLIMAQPLLSTVKRYAPEFVRPSKPTPHEIKLLSDIDDQEGLRFQIPVIQFSKYDPNMAGKDPVDIIEKH